MGPEDKLLGQVNADNPPLNLTTTDVVIGEVLGLPQDQAKTRLTAVKGSGFRGGVDVTYRRLGLGKLFQFFDPVVDMFGVSEITPALLLGKIKTTYGVELSENEVVVTALSLPEGMFYLIEAKPDSIVYTESMTIRVLFDQTDITEVVHESYTSFVYPTEFDEQLPRLMDAALYSGGWFVPECKVELGMFEVGSPADENIAWLIQTLSGDDWVMDTTQPSEYNVAEAVVAFNGAVADYQIVAGDDFTLLDKPQGGQGKVMALQLAPLNTNMAGKLTFYY